MTTKVGQEIDRSFSVSNNGTVITLPTRRTIANDSLGTRLGALYLLMWLSGELAASSAILQINHDSIPCVFLRNSVNPFKRMSVREIKN